MQHAGTTKSKEPRTAQGRPIPDGFWSRKPEQPGFICLILLIAIALVYSPVGGFEFVNYDDPDYISANPHVQAGLTWESVYWAFTTGHASNWHPLTWLSHMLDWQLFGPGPRVHHLVNVGFHALNTILLFIVLRRMTGAHWLSALVAGLFGLHPLRAESVAWVSERKDVLSGLFFLLTIAAYGHYVRSSGSARKPGLDAAVALKVRDHPHSSGLKPAKNRKLPRPDSRQAEQPKPGGAWVWYSLSLAAFALGLMSKPMLVTVPFCLLLLDSWPLERFRLEKQDTQQFPKLLLEKVPFFILAAASSLASFLVQRRGGAVSTSLSAPERLANALVSYVRYLGKTVWPENLSVLYPHPGHWPAWQVAGSAAVLVVITTGVIVAARRRPYLAVGWFWFIGSLVPVIGLIQVGMQSMADRYTYIPSVGLFILMIWGLADLIERQPAARPLAIAAALGSLIICGLVTSHQIRFWHDSEALFQRAIQVTSNNYLAYNNLGFDLSAKGRLSEAKQYYQKSIAINPQYPDALNNMGYALAGEKKFAEAIPYYETALRFSPNQPEIHNNLGNALSELGNIRGAIEQYSIVLSEKPDHADANNNLGIALAMQGKLDEAIGHFRAALHAKPNYASAHSNLGNGLAAQHKIAEAVVEYQESLRLNPNDPQAHNNLGNALVELGRLEEAREQYTQAIRLNPNNPEAYFNLGVVFLKENKRAEAAAHFGRALELNPGNAEARRQLQVLLGNAETLKN